MKVCLWLDAAVLGLGCSAVRHSVRRLCTYVFLKLLRLLCKMKYYRPGPTLPVPGREWLFWPPLSSAHVFFTAYLEKTVLGA